MRSHLWKLKEDAGMLQTGREMIVLLFWDSLIMD
jgi:hypothetical protein